MNSKIQLTETMSLPGVSQKSQDYGCASCPGKTFALLRKAGFEEVRRRGSLILVQKKLSPGIVTVPVPPDHGEIRIGTLRSIIRNPAYHAVSSKSDLERHRKDDER